MLHTHSLDTWRRPSLCSTASSSPGLPCITRRGRSRGRREGGERREEGKGTTWMDRLLTKTTITLALACPQRGPNSITSLPAPLFMYLTQPLCKCTPSRNLTKGLSPKCKAPCPQPFLNSCLSWALTSVRTRWDKGNGGQYYY